LLWDVLIGRLQPYDTIVISKLSNALDSIRQFTFFLELCHINNIRLISIHDRIDTEDKLFFNVSTAEILKAIALLPKEANAIRKTGNSVMRIKKPIVNKTKKTVVKTERDKRIINMYIQGFSINDIMKDSGFSSKSSIWRILNNANIELTRGHTRGPLGPRLKKRKIKQGS
jgi:DNA invertase Pin-like site-specific DNA recombinase